jgi:hypothetical protein
MNNTIHHSVFNLLNLFFTAFNSNPNNSNFSKLSSNNRNPINKPMIAKNTHFRIVSLLNDLSMILISRININTLPKNDVLLKNTCRKYNRNLKKDFLKMIMLQYILNGNGSDFNRSNHKLWFKYLLISLLLNRIISYSLSFNHGFLKRITKSETLDLAYLFKRRNLFNIGYLQTLEKLGLLNEKMKIKYISFVFLIILFLVIVLRKHSANKVRFLYFYLNECSSNWSTYFIRTVIQSINDNKLWSTVFRLKLFSIYHIIDSMIQSKSFLHHLKPFIHYSVKQIIDGKGKSRKLKLSSPLLLFIDRFLYFKYRNPILKISKDLSTLDNLNLLQFKGYSFSLLSKLPYLNYLSFDIQQFFDSINLLCPSNYALLQSYYPYFNVIKLLAYWTKDTSLRFGNANAIIVASILQGKILLKIKYRNYNYIKRCESYIDDSLFILNKANCIDALRLDCISIYNKHNLNTHCYDISSWSSFYTNNHKLYYLIRPDKYIIRWNQLKYYFYPDSCFKVLNLNGKYKNAFHLKATIVNINDVLGNINFSSDYLIS